MKCGIKSQQIGRGEAKNCSLSLKLIRLFFFNKIENVEMVAGTQGTEHEWEGLTGGVTKLRR
jgi:hypothetical protein